MKLTLTTRLDRLEEQRNPMPPLIVACRDPGESEEAARARIIAAQGLRPDQTLVICSELDWAL